jgi:uncharacterized protein (DUF58 family)
VSRGWPLTLRGTGAALLAVACFVVAHEAGLVELLYFGLLLAAVVVVSILSLHLARRSEEVTRTLSPDVAAVGRESAVRVRVGLRSALPTAPGEWADARSAGLRGRAAGVFPALGSALGGSDRTVELRYRVEGVSRGIHWLGPLAVTTTDPFGLARRRYRLGERTRVTVAPAIVEFAALPAVPGESGGMLQTANAHLGQGADNLVARPYAPGDSMRRIHWRATAHRDTLMVRQEEQEASPEATVVLDRSAARWGAGASSAPGADPGFEAAVSASVSAVMRLTREGYTVEVVDSDGIPLSEPVEAGEVHDVEALATALATMTARAGDDLRRVPALFAGILTGPVVVVTAMVTPDDAEALAPLAHHSALPVLLALDTPAAAVDRVRAAGWHASAFSAYDDLADAWETAIERGAVSTRVG